ncbi:MAG TPA: hypothetical protein PKE47_16260 [Verrucomicrobiota bacterium]|nr:hypothetical protein [Verrucomicrobiota bacterium]
METKKKTHALQCPAETTIALFLTVCSIAAAVFSLVMFAQSPKVIAMSAKWHLAAGFSIFGLCWLAFGLYSWSHSLAEENAELREQNAWLRENKQKITQAMEELEQENNRLQQQLRAREAVLARFRENLHLPLDQRPMEEMTN